MIERLELEAFLVLADELHFGRTAERLHVTTGRVSQTIKKLERHIGAPLFERTSRNVELTALGRQLHDDLRPGYDRITAGLERAIAQVRSPVAELRVGYVSAAAGQIARQAADRFPERDPDCRIVVRELQVGDAVGRLRGGDVDLLILSLPMDAPDIVVGPVLVSEPRLLAVPADHALARRDTIGWEDLAELPLLRLAGAGPGDWPADRRVERTPSGRPVAAGPQFETFQEALQLVGAGTGAMIVGGQVTRFYTRPDVTYVPFADAAPLDWAPVWLASATTPRHRTFADTAREVANRIYVAVTHG